ncbi:MAG: RNA ligase family protein [Actinomycetes bacterium]
MDFQKYMHIERFGNTEVEGIEFGECFIFPKIDGTNGQLWYDTGFRAGSRNRELSLDNDNQGFMNWAVRQTNFMRFFEDYPHLKLFGEWLVPHTLRTYRPDAWQNFYVFDVANEFTGELMHYNEYSVILDLYGINYIPPICIIRNPTYEDLTRKLDSNIYLIQDGKGFGEGIVIKNYAYKNKFGRQVWAKIVRNEFKEKHVKAMGSPAMDGTKMIEEDFIEKYLTLSLVEKTQAKIINETGMWSSKMIPRLLQTVYYDLVTEETWNFIKDNKLPTINFKTLNYLTVNKIKQIKPQIFN